MLSVLAALLVFGLIVLIHEFGHFLFAKRGGITVDEFSIGMGPRIFSFERGGTRYSLKILPFGGSCMMRGEDEANSDPGAFNTKPVWTRIKVIAAGPVFNFILAFVFACLIVGYTGYDPAEVISVVDGYPAKEAGIREGDVIKNLNGSRIHVYREVQNYTMFHPGETLEVVYERDGEKYETVITPRYSEENGGYLMGITGGTYRPTENILQTLEYGAYEVTYWIKLVVKSLGMLIQGQVGREDIAGPVRIVAMIDSTVEMTRPYGLAIVLLELANLTVMLSANLGVMNLLPIPALDGGRLVFLLIEALRGKPVDPEKEGMVHLTGMALLMTLMVFILFNDISNLFLS